MLFGLMVPRPPIPFITRFFIFDFPDMFNDEKKEFISFRRASLSLILYPSFLSVELMLFAISL